MNNLEQLFYRDDLKWLSKSIIYLCKYGSHAYGLNCETSDLDLRGICIPPVKFFIGYLDNFEQAEFKQDFDGVIYNIKKFFRLAADCNPSIIEQLFVDEEDILFCSEYGRKLLNIRHEFLSKKVKWTFGQYASSQVKRVNAHRRWLRDESIMQKPTRGQFGLPEQNVLSAEIRGAAEKLEVVFSDNIMELLHREKQYAAACREYENFLTWKKERNPKRAEIERKIGYDGKHVSQLIRLYLMATEILRNGEVRVKRPVEEREWLIGIKTGNTDWKFEDVMNFVNSKTEELDKLYETSTLPHTPNHKLLNDTLMDITLNYYDLIN